MTGKKDRNELIFYIVGAIAFLQINGLIDISEMFPFLKEFVLPLLLTFVALMLVLIIGTLGKTLYKINKEEIHIYLGIKEYEEIPYPVEDKRDVYNLPKKSLTRTLEYGENKYMVETKPNGKETVKEKL